MATKKISDIPSRSLLSFRITFPKPKLTHSLALSHSLSSSSGSTPQTLTTTMVAEPRSYDPVDPLSSYSGLALFPTTFQVPPDPSKPSHADIDAIHNHLKSIVLSLTLLVFNFLYSHLISRVSEFNRSICSLLGC